MTYRKALDKMDRILEQNLLYDFYGELLTEHQQRVYEDAVYNDMSLSEIAGEQGISRQGVHDLIKQYAIEHQKIIFNGNGYSEEWVKEAKRRGLSNIRSMVEAIPALTTEKSVKMFERFKVLTKAELESRAPVAHRPRGLRLFTNARAMATRCICPPES